MKLEKLSVITEIVGSIAIVVTLIYLAVEVRQNTEALNAQSRQSVLTAAQTELLFSAEHPNITSALVKPGPLTTEDNVQLDAYFTASLRAREYAWLQYQNGTIDNDQWRTEVAVIKSIFSSPRIRLWWNKLGQTYFSTDFSAFINNVIKDLPASRDDWEAITKWSNP